MAKKSKNLLGEMFEMTKEQREKIERRARREAELEFVIKPYATKVHKNKKAYSRKAKYKSNNFDY